MSDSSLKNKFEFILVEPSHPGNIGATARAIKNMGFQNLSLVNPKDFSVIESKHLGSKLSAVFGELDSKENKLALISSRNRLYVFK